MENKFEEWVIIEVFGHRRLAGKATEASILGGALLRLDIPTKDGKFVTQFIGPASIFSMTPTTEDIARSVAVHNQPEPVSRWELPQLVQPGNPLEDPYARVDDPCDAPGGSGFYPDDNGDDEEAERG